MTPAITAIDARWVVPVQPDGVVLTNHSVVIAGELIVDVLPSSEVEDKYLPTNRIGLGEHILIPGLVNAHTHSPMTLLRGIADDLPLMTWLQDFIWPAEAKWVSPRFVRDGTTLAVAEMLRSGTTCFSDMYFYPDVSATVAQSLGMRMVAGLICLDAPTGYADGPSAYLRKGAEVNRGLAGLPLVTGAFAPHAPYTLSDEPWRQLSELATELDLPVHTHLHETAAEVTDSIREYGMRPIDRLARLGVINDRLIAAHFTQSTDADVALLAESGASVVNCPESNLKLASGFCQVAGLQTGGVNVAIGTDGAASNNDLDMIAELRLSTLLAKGTAGDATVVPARTALRMATLDGARALHLDDRIGSIEAGKQADLTALRLSDLSSHPIYDPLSQLVYTATRDQVTDVWVAGNERVRNGNLVDIDVAEVRARADEWAARISS